MSRYFCSTLSLPAEQQFLQRRMREVQLGHVAMAPPAFVFTVPREGEESLYGFLPLLAATNQG